MHSKSDANNLAYTSLSLPLHGDLPYYDYQPGVSGKPILVREGSGPRTGFVVVGVDKKSRARSDSSLS